MSEMILLNSHLHLNHYAIQSYNWFKEVKMKEVTPSQPDLIVYVMTHILKNMTIITK